ncbi:MAG TPA: hypothetical protein VF588_07435 [Pyrinomonadaceae bacterium]
MEKVSYLNLPNCRRLSNGTVEVIVTAGVGPRVLRYSFVGGENIFGEYPEASVETEWGVWRPRGGHRLWAAPEASPRSYAPDDAPLEVSEEGALAARFAQPPDARTGLGKEILVELDAEGSGVRVIHRVSNQNVWAVELAPWALTIMRPGGEVVIPQEPFGAHPQFLLPARPLVLWHYTNLSDPRLFLGPRLVCLKPDEHNAAPQKIGLLNKQGWAAYRAGGEVFVKTYAYEEGATYPDYNCNTQVFTAGAFVEVETLGPLKRLEPGQFAEHEERWMLFRDVSLGEGEGAVADALKPLALAASRAKA